MNSHTTSATRYFLFYRGLKFGGCTRAPAENKMFAFKVNCSVTRFLSLEPINCNSTYRDVVVTVMVVHVLGALSLWDFSCVR